MCCNYEKFTNKVVVTRTRFVSLFTNSISSIIARRDVQRHYSDTKWLYVRGGRLIRVSDCPRSDPFIIPTSYMLQVLCYMVGKARLKHKIKNFHKTKECYYCARIFIANITKVYEHDHFSGKYRGAAYVKCNASLREQKQQLPIIIHNFCIIFYYFKMCGLNVECSNSCITHSPHFNCWRWNEVCECKLPSAFYACTYLTPSYHVT